MSDDDQKCPDNYGGPHALAAQIRGRCSCGAVWDFDELKWVRDEPSAEPEGGDDGSRFFGNGPGWGNA